MGKVFGWLEGLTSLYKTPNIARCLPEDIGGPAGKECDFEIKRTLFAASYRTGSMSSKTAFASLAYPNVTMAIRTISDIQSIVAEFAQKYGIQRIYLFSFYARGNMDRMISAMISRNSSHFVFLLRNTGYVQVCWQCEQTY